PPHQATTATPFVATVELLSSPFRPTPSLSPPATALPRCVVLGNTRGRRRRSQSATGAPSPQPPSLSLLSAEGRRRREEGEREKRKRAGTCLGP
ncbi:Os04g0345500, partial [Oryza sativa Japonica Group]